MASTDHATDRADTSPTQFGCEHFGRLTQVMLHRPVAEALRRVTRKNCREWLFDDAPQVEAFIEEHDRYRELLESHGVRVLELSDYLADHEAQLARLPNLTYMHDVAVVSSRGALLSLMAPGARRGEERVVRDALTALGIPILTEFDGPDDAFEGCLLLSPETLLVADTERHRRQTIDRFIPMALRHFAEVIYAEIPKARRFMHPDTIYNRVDHRLALAYLPAFRRTWRYTDAGAQHIEFAELMAARGIEILNVSDAEQRRLACSFVPLEPGVMMHYDTALDGSTRRALSQRNVEMVLFSPKALVAGGGSLRCLTLRLHRRPC